MTFDRNYVADLTLIPPSPVTDRVNLDVRVGIRNQADRKLAYAVVFFALSGVFDEDTEAATLVLLPGESGVVRRWMPASALCGRLELRVGIRCDGAETVLSTPLLVIPSDVRSIRRIDGAFVGFYHWSEEEGRLWNSELKELLPRDWRDLIRAQHELGMDIVVPQEMFRNEKYVGKHEIETDGYQGKAYYPSALFSHRMPIKCLDPLEVVLSEADALGMHVFLSVGMYAWFDFSPGSLNWHKEVASELWRRYGHHQSVYGWYVSEEIFGNLGQTNELRENIISFFREFQTFCRLMTPAKPVMLAPNCYGISESQAYYRRLLPYIDILCPFGFHRMPDGDISGREAAILLQELCDEAQTHLWLDLEAFLFGPDNALYPRPIEALIEDLSHFPEFEKIICYQFPGIFNAPWSRRKPGGTDTVRLFEGYKAYLATQESESQNRIAEKLGTFSGGME